MILHCSLFTGPNVTFLLTNKSMTWTEAQRYCREHHTDLASVRNMAENQKVQELSTGENVWIGLFRDSWKWLDGTNSSFRYWNQEASEPNNKYSETCAAADFSHSGKWEDWNCNFEKAFICYRGMLSFT